MKRFLKVRTRSSILTNKVRTLPASEDLKHSPHFASFFGCFRVNIYGYIRVRVRFWVRVRVRFRVVVRARLGLG